MNVAYPRCRISAQPGPSQLENLSCPWEPRRGRNFFFINLLKGQAYVTEGLLRFRLFGDFDDVFGWPCIELGREFPTLDWVMVC